MNTMIIIRTYLMAVLLCVLSPVVLADHKAFQADSLQQIEKKYAGKTFLLVLWEVSCFPCHEEMDLISELRLQHPDANIVMVSTDNISKQAEVTTMLKTHGLDDVDSWLFADANVEKLRYNIDPEWFGELPRNYIYDTDSSRIGMSGKLTPEILQEWLKTM